MGYHRIGKADSTNGYAGVFSANPDDFRAQIRYLQSRFRVVTFDEILAAGPDLSLREPCVLITFDDGYRDNLEVALPILQELGATATFFLPTDFLDRPHLFWWDRLALIFNKTAVDHIILTEPFSISADLRVISREAAIALAVDLLLAADPYAIGPWLDRLERAAQVTIDDEEIARSLLIDWKAASALIAAGMTVGSHARSHRNLARLDETVQRDELFQSKARLESQLGVNVTALAYPYGVASAFNATTLQIAYETGYKIAFGFGGGINRPGNSPALAMVRVNVGSSDTLAMFQARAVFLSTFGRSVF